MNKRLFRVFLLLFIINSSISFAEDFPTDDISLDQALAEDKGITQEQKDFSLRDKTEIGGSIFSDFYYSTYSDKSFNNNVFTNTNLGYVYLDSKLPEDVRFFLKGKFVYTPTSEGELSPVTGETYEKLSADLDEAKIMFNTYNSVFFTLGKQKVKYGAAKFWNPTDFLNQTMKNPFYDYDRRTGLPLVKIHVPINSSNFYLIGDLDDARNIDQVSYVVRYELPLEASEFSISTRAKKDAATKLGFDLSTALYEIDVYAEASVSKGSDKIFYTQAGTPYMDTKKAYWTVSAGMSYEMPFLDADSITFSLEYYYNGEGYKDPSMYGVLWLKKAYVPLNTAKQYAMFMVYAPNPGSWNDTNISVFNIANLTDSSAITRAELMYLFTKDLSIGFNITGHYGKSSGEFRLYGQLLDFGVRLELNF
jgi:hypothetical protein